MKTDEITGSRLWLIHVTLGISPLIVLIKVHQPLFNSFLGFLVSNLAVALGAAEQQQQLSKIVSKQSGLQNYSLSSSGSSFYSFLFFDPF